jgi:hypothetical protein
MNCRSARANFSKYIEQELCEVERRDIAAHLARCPKCSSDLFAMQKAMSLLRWVPRHEGRPGFEERLMQRIRSEESPPITPVAGIQSRLRDLADKWHQLSERWQETVTAAVMPAPAVALLTAVLVGGGLGAILVGTVGDSAGVAGTSVATTPEIRSAPEFLPREGVDQSPVLLTDNHPAPPARTPEEPSVLHQDSRDVLVAPWVTPGDGERLGAAPEGPPSISRVEYVLDWVDVNGGRVEQLPASAIVANGTVTF